MKIIGRYGEQKRKERDIRNKSILIGIIGGTIIGLGVFFFTSYVNAYAETMVAVCPVVDVEGRECGSVIEVVDYLEFEVGTFEYWNAYCNIYLGTIKECD